MRPIDGQAARWSGASGASDRRQLSLLCFKVRCAADVHSADGSCGTLAVIATIIDVQDQRHLISLIGGKRREKVAPSGFKAACHPLDGHRRVDGKLLLHQCCGADVMGGARRSIDAMGRSVSATCAMSAGRCTAFASRGRYVGLCGLVRATVPTLYCMRERACRARLTARASAGCVSR